MKKNRQRSPQAKNFRLVLNLSLIAIALMAAMPFIGEVGSASTQATTTLGKWVGFLGAFHPLILHLPIGVVLLVLVMELAALFSRGRYQANTLLPLAFASISAVFASIFGYLLYLTGDCAGMLIEDHKRDGIIFTIVLIVTFLIKYRIELNKNNRWLPPVYVIGLIATTLTLISTGHHGGEITHGDPMDKAPWKAGSSTNAPQRTRHHGNDGQPSVDATPTYDPIVYTDIIAPILVEKCNKCHGDNKQKGGLRMDSYAALIRGGDYEECLVPGDIEKSTMISFLHLPLDDDLRMPPENKPQLTEDEITILTWWVKEDAPEFKKLSEIPQTPEVEKALKPLQ